MIRRAKMEDLDEIMRAGRKFFESHPINIKWNAVETRKVISDMIKDHVILVDIDRGYLRGMIGGIVAPNFLNPNVTFLTELFWYVSEKHRSSSLGIRLWKEFEQLGEEMKVDAIIMSLLSTSPINLGDVYNKKGYEFQESAYVRRIQ